MLIDEKIKNLVKAIEGQPQGSPGEINRNIAELVGRLDAVCKLPENVARYANRDAPTELGAYPIDKEGYAVASDPLEDEAGFWACWQKYGFVVGKQVIPPALCKEAQGRIAELAKGLSGGAFEVGVPESWGNIPVDEAGVPLISRGFLEVYHDALIAKLRQAVRVYVHHVVIWGRADLWTTFDRLGVKLPSHEDGKGLPLHVDQNPLVHPEFKTLQGVLALVDCPAERGTFVGVPGSRGYFHEYKPMARNNGEYVELALEAPVAAQMEQHAQKIPLRAGDLVSWDSRTTHGNSSNVSQDVRMVAYLSAGPAPKDVALREVRKEAFESGKGSNVREALMHASKPPRYANVQMVQGMREPEELTLLGEMLYGWRDVGADSPVA